MQGAGWLRAGGGRLRACPGSTAGLHGMPACRRSRCRSLLVWSLHARPPAPHPPGKEIHFVETGVGGGVSPQGDRKATTADEAAYTPFFGEGALGVRSAGAAWLAERAWTGAGAAGGAHRKVTGRPRLLRAVGAPLPTCPLHLPAHPSSHPTHSRCSAGMSGPYTRANDPFLLWDPSRPSPVRGPWACPPASRLGRARCWRRRPPRLGPRLEVVHALRWPRLSRLWRMPPSHRAPIAAPLLGARRCGTTAAGSTASWRPTWRRAAASTTCPTSSSGTCPAGTCRCAAAAWREGIDGPAAAPA